MSSELQIYPGYKDEDIAILREFAQEGIAPEDGFIKDLFGLHSRKLDGDRLEMFAAAGWVLEHEKPTRFVFHAGAASLEAMTQFDGTQVWRNPRL